MKDFQLIHIRNHQVEDRDKIHRWLDEYLDSQTGGKDRDMEMWFDDTDKTQSQNRYYWSQVGKMARHFGSSVERIHEYFKSQFLPSERYIVMVIDKKMASTKGTSKDQMSQFIEKCIQWSAEELGYVWGDCEEYKHKYQ